MQFFHVIPRRSTPALSACSAANPSWFSSTGATQSRKTPTTCAAMPGWRIPTGYPLEKWLERCWRHKGIGYNCQASSFAGEFYWRLRVHLVCFDLCTTPMAGSQEWNSWDPHTCLTKCSWSPSWSYTFPLSGTGAVPPPCPKLWWKMH